MPKTIGLRVTDSLNAAIEKKAYPQKPSAWIRYLVMRELSSEKPPSLPPERPVQARKPKTTSPETCEHEWTVLPLSKRSICEKCGSAK